MDIRVLVQAISARDQVKAGRYGRKELRHRIRQEYTAGNWSRSQLAAIFGYSPQGVGRVVRGAQPPATAPTGGTLHPECLDLALALYGAQTSEQRRNLIDACIRTNTSTRLIAEMTGQPLSTISYRKSRMKENR